MFVKNISTISTYNQGNVAFSGKMEVAKKAIELVRSPHISSQILSQVLAPFIFNFHASFSNSTKMKIFGDVVEAGCNLIARKKISIKDQPTSFIALAVSGLRKILQGII